MEMMSRRVWEHETVKTRCWLGAARGLAVKESRDGVGSTGESMFSHMNLCLLLVDLVLL